MVILMELLSPKLDIVFKTLFSANDSRDILSDFLAAVLDIDVADIENIDIQNTEIMPELIDHKYSRLDLVVKVRDKLINVEMQVKKLSDFTERALFYWAKLYAKELGKGESYRNLNQTISINILDYNMFDCEECHSVFHISEDTRHEILTDKCRFDFLELPKAATDSKQIKRLKRWLDFFNLKSEEDADMLARENDQVMNKAVLTLRKMSADEKMREIARVRERALHDEASYIQDAIDEGMAKGIAQGRAEGKTEGMAEGREQAINEIMEKLRSLGMDEETLRKAVDI